MWKRLLAAALLLATTALPAHGRERVSGWCEQGGNTVTVGGLTSTESVQQSFPSCVITVYDVGTLNLASIFSDDSGTVKSNPFTASSTGFWFFLANDARYDIRLSGGGIVTPFTIGDILLDDTKNDVTTIVSVASSATPTFDASLGTIFTNTLTANVTSSTISNPVTGQRITLYLAQDGTGGWTFAWPANVQLRKSTYVVADDISAVSVIKLYYDGTNWRETGRDADEIGYTLTPVGATLTVAGNIIPSTTNKNLGSTTTPWGNIVVDEANAVRVVNANGRFATIQAAVDGGTGGTVFFPPNATETISATISLPSDTWLICGAGSTITAGVDFGDNPMIRNTTQNPATDGARDTNIRVIGCNIDGNKANNSTGTEFSHCINLKSVVDAVVEGITCTDPKGDGILIGSGSTTTVNPLRNTIENFTSINADRNGGAMTEGEEINWTNFRATNPALHGLDLEANNDTSFMKAVNIDGLTVIDGGTTTSHHCLSISGAAVLPIEGVTVTGLNCRNQTGHGVGFRAVDGVILSGFVIDTVGGGGVVSFVGASPAITGAVIGPGSVDTPTSTGVSYNIVGDGAVTVIGVTVRDGLADCFRFNKGVGHTITGNVADNCALRGFELQGTQKSTFVGNQALNNTGAGFRLLLSGSTEASFNTFVGNSAIDNGAWGMDEGTANSPDSNVFVFNILTGNSSGALRRRATATNSVYGPNIGDTADSNYPVTHRFLRLKTTGATLVAGDIAIATTGAWGDTADAAVSAVTGNDQWFQWTITAGGANTGANPTIIITFTDGTWSGAPNVMCNRQSFNVPATVTVTVTTVTATVITLTFDGTPTATNTYRFACHVGGVQ